MRLGIGSYTYGWAVGLEGDRPSNPPTALDLIGRATELGVGVLQLCDNLPTSTYSDAGLEAIAAAAEKHDVQIELGTRGIAADHLRRFAHAARRLGSAILRVVIDTPDDQPSPHEVVARLGSLVPLFEQVNVVLAIENHDRLRIDELAAIIRQINSPYVGICLDTANSFGALEGPRVVVEAVGPCTVNLHLKDIVVQRVPGNQGFTIEGRPTGHGMLDIPWILGRLRDFGRHCNAIIELWTPPERSVEDTIRKEARWAELSVQTARQWIKE